MKIRFYFDPICPWCWITSRWLTEVQEDRDLEVEFCSFSLAIKNDILHNNDDNQFAPQARLTHGLLRIVEKIKQEKGNEARELVTKFYSAVGRVIHVENNSDGLNVEDVLSAIGLDPSFAKAKDDDSLDKAVESSMDKAMESVGNDVGVPILILETSNGDRGFFGPVISELPSKEEGLTLFDSISGMIAIPGFYELKRTREIGPDTGSTARTFNEEASGGSDGEACPIG